MSVAARALTGLAAVLTLLFAAVPAAAAPDVQGRVTEFRLAPGARAQSLLAGPDGNLWFAGLRHGPGGFTDLLGKVTADGQVTETPLGTHPEYLGLGQIVAGSEGDLWLVFGGRPRLGRVSIAGQVSEFELPTVPSALAAGPDGDLWYTSSSGLRVGRITPSGTVTQFGLEGPFSTGPVGIAAGSDGALWVTEPGEDTIARIGTDGSQTRFSLADEGFFPLQIVAGPDGALWFSETKESAVGRIDTTGQATQFPVPGGRQTSALASGPAGLLWYSNGAGRIGSIAPDGTTGSVACIRSCRLPIASLTAGPEGKLWFAAGAAPGEGLDARGTIGTFAPPRLRAGIDRAIELRGREVVVTVLCEGGAAGQRCEGRLRLLARLPGGHGLQLLRERRLSLALGAERRLSLRLSAPAAQALVERRRLGVRVESEVTGGAHDRREAALRLP